MSGLDFPDNFMAIFGFHRVQEDKMNAQTGIKPVAEYSDIVDTFEKMIGETGSTTTLDVKRDLRDRGFWVKQADVSEALDRILDDEDGDKYSFYIDGNHRVYTLNDSSAQDPAITYGWHTPITRVSVRAKRVPVLGNWEVTDGEHTHLFTGLTRNQARYQFSKMYGVPYITTKARRDIFD